MEHKNHLNNEWLSLGNLSFFAVTDTCGYLRFDEYFAILARPNFAAAASEIWRRFIISGIAN